MSLDPAYLNYPMRRRGMDHDLYPWSNIFTRPPIVWPDGGKVAIWIVVSLEWFPIIPSDKPFRSPGHMQTAYPDYRHYTSRDYGTRVGLPRLLKAFAARGIKVSVAANSVFAARAPELLSEIAGAGHELIGHATDMNATIASTLPEVDERAIIHASLDQIEGVIGKRPKGWHSIARSQSWRTPALLAEAGVEYMCDWVNDDMPYAMTVPGGSILNLPLSHELSDRQIVNVQQQSVESYAEQIRDAYAWLAQEAAASGGRMLPLHLTPYIMGLPYRMDAFEALLDWLKVQPGAWFARGDNIAKAFGRP